MFNVNTLSSSITDTVKPPKIAGATLSGWPSIAVANSRISCRSSTLSLKAKAPTIPATIQVELLPNPRV